MFHDDTDPPLILSSTSCGSCVCRCLVISLPIPHLCPPLFPLPTWLREALSFWVIRLSSVPSVFLIDMSSVAGRVYMGWLGSRETPAHPGWAPTAETACVGKPPPGSCVETGGGSCEEGAGVRGARWTGVGAPREGWGAGAEGKLDGGGWEGGAGAGRRLAGAAMSVCGQAGERQRI